MERQIEHFRRADPAYAQGVTDAIAKLAKQGRGAVCCHDAGTASRA
ncbi:catalase [Paraburkholderia silvatlantica]|uniref:Catalase n=1 Tax=Paraburkholderia silvatlantica TaxID=321895 RepID=A0ABR6FTH1_9BURK|nr:catalase [Paraburkholderia silvatlantica]